MNARRPLYFLVALWSLVLAGLLVHFYPWANKFDWLNDLRPFVLMLGFASGLGFFGFFAWKKERGLGAWPLAFLLAYIVWGGLAFIFAEVRSFGFAELLVGWSMASVFLLFVGENGAKRHMPVALSLTLVVQSILGVFAFLSTDHQRFFGLFYNANIAADAWPNAFALFFLLSFPWLLHFLFLESRRWIFPKALLTGFVLGTFFMSLSRAGFLAFGIQMLLFAVFLYKDKHYVRPTWKVAVFALLTLLLCASATVHGLQTLKIQRGEATSIVDRLEFTEPAGSVSLEERLEFFAGATELIQKKPVFGYGPFSFKFVYGTVQKGFLAISDHPHNILLQIGVNQGVPAIIFFLGLLAFLFFGNNPFGKEASLIDRTAWAAVLGAMAHSMVDFNFNFLSTTLLFWLSLSTLAPAKPFSRGLLGTQKALVFVLFAGLILCSALIYKQGRLGEDMVNHQLLLPRWTLVENGYLEEQLRYNPYDADALIQLGRYKEALAVRPKGDFRVYLGLDDASFIAFCPQIKSLMEEYLPLYEMNLHYTQAGPQMGYMQSVQTRYTALCEY